MNAWISIPQLEMNIYRRTTCGLYLGAPIVCVQSRIVCAVEKTSVPSNQYKGTPTRARTYVLIAFSNLITSIFFLCKALFSSPHAKFLWRTSETLRRGNSSRFHLHELEINLISCWCCSAMQKCPGVMSWIHIFFSKHLKNNLCHRNPLQEINQQSTWGGGGFWLVCLDAFWGSSIDFVLIKAFVAWAENNC